jgi:hypothetical protein
MIAYSDDLTERIPRRWAATLGMSFAAFVLAHDLVFLATYGASYDAAMQRTGHGPMWAWTVISAVVISVALAALATRRIRALTRATRRLGASPGEMQSRSLIHLSGHVLRLFGPILVIALVLFVIVENAEHLSAGLAAPGLSVLIGSPDYASTLPVFLGVALLVASIGALYRWRQEVLSRALGFARWWSRHHRRVITAHPVIRDRRPSSHVGQRLAGRAPPRAGTLRALT